MKQQYKTTNKITQPVINEILKVEQDKGLTAENLLEIAKNKTSALHNLFEWDNTVAGEQWRLQQARVIINEVKIIVNSKEMYAFENVRVKIENDGNERQYKPIMEILSDEDYKAQIIQQALDNISYWKEKYSEYSELKPIFVSIDKVKKQWQKKQ